MNGGASRRESVGEHELGRELRGDERERKQRIDQASQRRIDRTATEQRAGEKRLERRERKAQQLEEHAATRDALQVREQNFRTPERAQVARNESFSAGPLSNSAAQPSAAQPGGGLGRAQGQPGITASPQYSQGVLIPAPSNLPVTGLPSQFVANSASVAAPAATGPSAATTTAGEAAARIDGLRSTEAKSAAQKVQRPQAPEQMERARQILDQLRIELRPRRGEATIQLHPEELGSLTIRIKVKDGELHAVIRAEQAETLSVLEKHLPELRSMLERAGFDVAQFDLGLADSSLQGEREKSGTGNEMKGAALRDAIVGAQAMQEQAHMAHALADATGIDFYA